MSPSWSGEMKARDASHTWHRPSHSGKWLGQAALSLPAEGDHRGQPLSQEAARWSSFVLCPPELPPRAQQAEQPPLPAGQGFRGPGLWAVVLGLGLWGDEEDVGPPTSLPPSQAQPLLSQASLWTQDRPLGSRQLSTFPRRADAPCSSHPSDSLFPWPTATTVSWQEAGARLCRGHRVWCARATQPGGSGAARRVGPTVALGSQHLLLSPGFWAFSFFFSTMKKEVT